MPRKKTIQPDPIETLTYVDDDGDTVIIEVRDESCQIVGKGLHKRDAYERKRDAVLEKVAKNYLTPNGRKFIPTANNYLATPSAFASKVTRLGIEASGNNDATLRKKLYKDIVLNITALENAIKEKKQ